LGFLFLPYIDNRVKSYELCEKDKAMASIVPTSLVFRVNFNVYANTITLSDLHSYGGNYSDIFSVIDPDGVITYQNPGWAANDFSSPDLTQATLTKVIACPLDLSTNFAKLGNYTFLMKNSIDGGATYSETSKVLTMDYVRPYPNISLVADTNSSTLKIADNTNYNVLHNGNPIIPSLTFSQILVAPINPVTGLPVVANVTSTQKTFTVGPDIYTRVYVDTIDTAAVYSLETWNNLVWAIVTDTILGSNKEDVKDDTCMCAYYQCIASLQLQMEMAEGKDPLEYTKLRKAMLLLDDYMNLYLWSVKCGKDSAYWCKKIRWILQIHVPCDCAQDDDAPHIIVPISGGGGGSSTPSTFVYTFGTGSSGFPVSPHAGDIHEFTDTSGVYNKGDIYQYNGTAWVFEMNTQGEKGDPGANASGVSAVNLYSDLTSSGTPAGTDNTTLKTYTLPAPSMVNNGDQLKILASYILAENDNGKAAGITFNGDLVASYYTDALITDLTKYLRLEAEVNRINLISQMTIGGAKRLGGFINEPMQTLDSANLANAVVINATGQNDAVSANDLICNQLSVSLFSMINGAILGSSAIAQGIATLVANTPLDISFASTFPSTNYTISFNAYDNTGNPQSVTFDKNYKLTTGFRAESIVDCQMEWTCILT
jgi:hypothetical protein